MMALTIPWTQQRWRQRWIVRIHRSGACFSLMNFETVFHRIFKATKLHRTFGRVSLHLRLLSEIFSLRDQIHY